ncbi:MAG: condensation domain-containing protein, partial [Pyrinomonadaceae bacterium]|nr:condensation domain-containing protein [Pyrinomonadaceae bacterium]
MSQASKQLNVLSPTKRALVELLLKEKKEKQSRGQKILRRPESNVVPLSFAQQQLWFLDQLNPGEAYYNIPRALRLSGWLNVMALEQSLSEIIRRHEVLRTTFDAIQGEPCQIVSPSVPLSVPLIDLSHLEVTERETEARRLATEEAQKPFDLRSGPVLRATLLRMREDEHLLLLTKHHIVTDGISAGVFFTELLVLYEAFSQRKASPLTELPIQYADYAVWQREWLQGAVLDQQLSYWRKQLAGAPSVLDLPFDRPRPAVQSLRGAVHEFELDERLTAALRELSRAEGCTLFMTLLAAFQTLLYRYTGQDDLLIGTPMANRTRPELQGLIGYFINALIVRGDLSGKPTFRTLMRRVRDALLEGYAHQDLPFDKIVDELRVKRDLSYHPLFQVMFNFLNFPKPPMVRSLKMVEDDLGDTGMIKFDLTLAAIEGEQGLTMLFQYATDLFDDSTIARLAESFQ